VRNNLTYQALLLLVIGLSITARKGICADFLRGADISTQTKQEANGITYQEYGVPKDMLTILKNHDLNLIRIRLFHTPSGSDYGACQDLNYVTTLGARVKAAGFKFLLDMHYSDSWADPGKQYTPAAWVGYNHSQLVTAVHDYTRDVISHLRDNNAMPDIVQIGNEVTNGMLWPDGDIYNLSGSGSWSWDNFVELFNAGIEGVKDGRGSAAMPEIMVHIDRGGDKDGTQWFLETFQAHGANFSNINIIGESFFPEWHGTLDNMTECLNYIAQNYSQDIFIAETAEYYTGSTGKNPENQKAFLEELIHRVKNLSDANGTIKGRGICYWEPTWVWESSVAYKALFKPIDSSWTTFNMLPGMEAFDILNGDSILIERWTGLAGTAVSDLTSNKKYPSKPNSYGPLTSIEEPNGWGDNYGSRIRGHLHPPISGDYTFWIASDANSDLRLSTNANPANATRIAYVPGSTDPCQWTRYAEQQSSAISLAAGEDYYIEVLHKAGSGNDNLAVAWEGPELSREIIGGQYISPYIVIKNCTIKAGKTAGLDSIVLSGILGASTGMLSDANNVTIKIYSAANDINYIVYNQNIAVSSFTRSGNTYSYKHKIGSGESGGITSLSFDTNKYKFSLQAQKVNLTGLGCPLYLQTDIGAYSRIGFVDENAVNGKNSIPVCFMRTYKDTLVVNKAKAKHNGTKASSDKLSVAGDIAVINTDVNLCNYDVNFVWGAQIFSVPPKSFKAAKTGHLYKCSKVVADANGNTGLVTAQVDTDKATFTVSINGANAIDAASASIPFGISFADFNEAVDVNRVTGRSW
jgi:arabinogalactan endo-1,4-beta-galactosidase